MYLAQEHTFNISVMIRLFLSLMLLLPAMTFGKIIYIPVDYPTIQQGIDSAEENDTVLVDVGTYLENITISGKRIVVGSKFILTGDTSYIAQTIINGDNSGSVVIFGPDEVLDTRFSGFTITNGHVAGNGQGGGILIIATNPLLSNLLIFSNSAGRGAGIACINEGTLHLSDSRIYGNSASLKGGGIYNFVSNLFIDQCQLVQNSAGNKGGGAICFETSDTYDHTLHFEIRASGFVQNACNQYATGGVAITQTGELNEVVIHISESSFHNNTSKGNNALMISGENAIIDIRNCSFTENEAEQYSGGAAFLQKAHGKVIDCLFAQNKAATGGGNWNSGGATVWGGAEIEFINCTFADNEASYGAGLTIGGGALAHVMNSVFWNNTKDQIALLDLDTTGSFLGIGFSDVQHGQDSITAGANSVVEWIEGNIDLDPLFSGTGDYPYSLDKLSPCIDAGNQDTIGLIWPQYDLAGNHRFWDGDSNGILIIDMGAYEYGPSLLGMNPPGTNQPIIFHLFVYPNPSSSSVTIEFVLEQSEEVMIDFFNQSGKLVDHLETAKPAGLQKLTWTPLNLPNGIYYIRLKAGRQVASGRLLLIR